MTYTASDIINRAKNLADAGNTDFISYEEAMRYINDAYSEIYQKAIDIGDDFFVKRFTVGAGSTKLPNDFYGLRCIKEPYSGFLLKRKALDAAFNEPGYNIINGRLTIAGNSNYECSYYPLPKFITIQRAEEVIEDFEDNYTPVSDVTNQYYVYYTTEEGEPDPINKVIVYDFLNKTTEEITIDYIPSDIVCSRSSFFVKVGDIYKQYSYAGKFINTNSSVRLAKYKNGLIKTILYNSETKTLSVDNHDYVLEFTDGDTEYLNSIVIVSPAHFYYVDNHGHLYEYDRMTMEATVIDDGVDTKYLHYKEVDKLDGVVYYKDAPMIFSHGFNKSNLLDEIRQPIDCNYLNFYGINDEYLIYGDGVQVYKIGNIPETTLNYPKNQYFSLIAYSIATYIIAKQGGDVSIIAAQKEKALEDFYDQAQDQYMVERIKNVY